MMCNWHGQYKPVEEMFYSELMPTSSDFLFLLCLQPQETCLITTISFVYYYFMIVINNRFSCSQDKPISALSLPKDAEGFGWLLWQCHIYLSHAGTVPVCYPL